MMYRYLLRNEDASIQAAVMPGHGGMIGQIIYRGHPIFQLDEKMLETAPMAAGGMPLLFPFPSKTDRDTYEINGKRYHMPMHGLIKNAEFAVKEHTESSITLWIAAAPAWLAQYYPFAFYLEVTYEITAHGLEMTMMVENRSDMPMPHALGVHPYFLASDKKQVSLEHFMTTHYDHIKHTEQRSRARLALDRWLDDVLCVPEKTCFRLENPADHYTVACRYDEAFDTLVVCSWVPNSVCIEPWCGVPDACNQHRTCQSIPAREKKYYHISMLFSENERLTDCLTGER